MQQYIKLLRISHWTKNLFLFLPLFFSGKILADLPVFFEVALGFLCFSCSASAVYIINDIRDREADSQHPEKKHRPFASGKVSALSGIFIAALLIIAAIGGAYLIQTEFAIVLSLYFIINLFYSMGLKHIPILDITIIAIGFLLRIFAGGAIAGVPISQWIVVMTFLLAMFLGFAKRRDDVIIFIESGQKMRKSVDGYNLEFINASMVIMAAVVIVSYLMYTLSEDVTGRFDTQHLYITSIFVILGIIRYLQITFVQQRSGNPTKILLKDVFIQLVLLGWIAAFFIIIYVNKADIPI